MHTGHFNFDTPIRCEGEQETARLAGQFMDWLLTQPQLQPIVVSLQGNLGAGKSFFCRSMIQSIVPAARVKSPTYTLVEPYAAGELTIYHWDLYRLCDAQELEYMGLRDYLRPHTLHLVEWWENGAGVMPPPHFQVSLIPCGAHCRDILIRNLA